MTARLAARLVALLAHPPPAAAAQTPEEDAAMLLRALEASAARGATAAGAGRGAGHDEL